MVKLQLATNAIAKSRLQIKPKPIIGLSINIIFIFSMAGRCIFIAHTGYAETVWSFFKLNVEHHIEVEPDLDKPDWTVVKDKNVSKGGLKWNSKL